ncbi:major facilitator superfamily domain-containing protein 8 isoform X2 [Cimex lectularius]|uniref:Major facilitator superfamily (MFS) profile domain-containing protein n=1 Tax=Cimex lectularius TaxID=79782 RepID=A0A8I6RT08_CIMLE|nr:major facilitator superfamily domain-containing protein 8 isoform X2 [Cimex lectularius]
MLDRSSYEKACNDEDTKEKNNTLPLLETTSEYRERWISLKIMFFTTFLMSLGFSIVITGIWPYLRQLDPLATKEFMGYIVAAHPFAQMIFSPLIGWWGNWLKSSQIPFMFTMVLFVLSSGLYSSVELFSVNREYWMLSARFLIGACSANIALCRSYISSATKLEERTRAVSMISLAQVLGFIVGPGLQAAVTPLGHNGFHIWPGKLTVNMYTAAGWVNVVLGLINLILVTPLFFKEKSIAAKEAMFLSSSPSEKAAWKQIKPDYLIAWTMIIAFFAITLIFVLLESIGTTLAIEQFAWTDKEALSYIGILLSCGSIAACFIAMSIDKLSKLVGEVQLLIWGSFFLVVIGSSIYIPIGGELPLIAYKNASVDDETNRVLGCPEEQEWCLYTPAIGKYQYVIGFVLISIGYPIGITLIQTIFSKILGPRPQGVWMGLITGFGCLSRVVGPVFVVYIYTNLGTVWTFGLISALMVFSLFWLLIFKDRITNACLLALKLQNNDNEAKPEIELGDLEEAD